jgi:hypothetical protein
MELQFLDGNPLTAELSVDIVDSFLDFCPQSGILDNWNTKHF